MNAACFLQCFHTVGSVKKSPVPLIHRTGRKQLDGQPVNTGSAENSCQSEVSSSYICVHCTCESTGWFYISHYTHTHTRLTALFPGPPRWAGTRKVKPIWILLKQETVSGSGISWAICKSAPHSRQITTPAPYHSVFTGQVPFLPPNQQCQSTEG